MVSSITLVHPVLDISEIKYNRGDTYVLNHSRDFSPRENRQFWFVVEGECDLITPHADGQAAISGYGAGDYCSEGSWSRGQIHGLDVIWKAGIKKMQITSDFFKVYCVTYKNGKVCSGTPHRPNQDEKLKVQKGNYVFLMKGSMQIGNQTLVAPFVASIDSSEQEVKFSGAVNYLVVIPHQTEG